MCFKSSKNILNNSLKSENLSCLVPIAQCFNESPFPRNQLSVTQYSQSVTSLVLLSVALFVFFVCSVDGNKTTVGINDINNGCVPS